VGGANAEDYVDALTLSSARGSWAALWLPALIAHHCNILLTKVISHEPAMAHTSLPTVQKYASGRALSTWSPKFAPVF
jgi:hypothetical protein